MPSPSRIAVLVTCLLLSSSACGLAAPAGPGVPRTGPGSPPELAPLLQSLRDTTFLVRMQAVSAIAQLKDAGDVGANAVARVALHDRRVDIRISAAYELSRFPGSAPAILAVLEPAVADHDSTLRANAGFPLGHVAEISDGALPLLLTLTKDPAPTVRAAAGHGLKEVLRVWPGQVALLADAFSHCDANLRFDVGEALIPAGVGAVPAMLERIASPDWNVRANAARVLGAIGETDGSVAAALAARVADPDFRVRQYAVRALVGLATPAAHDALVRHDGGVETYGPVQKVLELHSFREKPDSSIVVVASTYREFRKPLVVPELGSPPPDLKIAEEHRLYWCDFERGTVRLLTRVDVPPEMREGFTVIVLGWGRGTLGVETYGMPAHHRYSPEYHGETIDYAVDPDGTFRRLAARPNADYVPTYRDLPSGKRQFWSIGVEKDRITKSVDDGPRRPIFHVDPQTEELLPGPP